MYDYLCDSLARGGQPAAPKLHVALCLTYISKFMFVFAFWSFCCCCCFKMCVFTLLEFNTVFS